ncbi:hypothetical protein J6590_039257 [Homalodisca vitripennis]|nr:hypothetical protein J6590_039257 [Homalodisca vitripennis]
MSSFGGNIVASGHISSEIEKKMRSQINGASPAGLLLPCPFKAPDNARFNCVSNTYTNAEKLLTAAEELAQTGECNADEIYSVAHELESHVTSFAARVDQRRRRLDLAVHFYTQEKEPRSWADEEDLYARKFTPPVRSWQHFKILFISNIRTIRVLLVYIIVVLGGNF